MAVQALITPHKRPDRCAVKLPTENVNLRVDAPVIQGALPTRPQPLQHGGGGESVGRQADRKLEIP